MQVYYKFFNLPNKLILNHFTQITSHESEIIILASVAVVLKFEARRQFSYIRSFTNDCLKKKRTLLALKHPFLKS